MTPADLDRLAALYEKATPGEWYLLGAPWLGRDMETSILAGSPDPHAAKFVCDFENFADDDEDKNGWNDADFIAALHNAFPALLEAARRYQWLTQMWPLEITLLVHSHHTHGPTSSNLHEAIDAAMSAAPQKEEGK